MCELKAMDAHCISLLRHMPWLWYIDSYYLILLPLCHGLSVVSALSRISLPLRLRSRGCGLRSCNLSAVDNAGGPGSTGAAGSSAWCSDGVKVISLELFWTPMLIL